MPLKASVRTYATVITILHSFREILSDMRPFKAFEDIHNQFLGIQHVFRTNVYPDHDHFHVILIFASLRKKKKKKKTEQ